MVREYVDKIRGVEDSVTGLAKFMDPNKNYI